MMLKKEYGAKFVIPCTVGKRRSKVSERQPALLPALRQRMLTALQEAEMK